MSFNDEYLKLRKKRLEEEEIRSEPTNQNPKVYLDTLFPKANSDIAPVRQTTQPTTTTDERKWFEKGAFEDGYQRGDFLLTMASSSADFDTQFLAGILGMGEKAVDTGAYIVGGIGGLFSKDFQDSTKDFIAKDLYDEEAIARKIIGLQRTPFSVITGIDKEDIMDESNSFFGEKSDALLQSGGQLAATVGLQSVGVPWFVTSGVMSFGSEVENAFNQGATYGQAGLSAAINAGVEIATEKLFGGSGLGEKGLINLDGLTKGISNKVGKALLDFGIDMTAEGAEEIASQIGSNFASALYSEKNLQELLLSEEAFDEYLESFIGGMALGGVANVGKVSNSIKTDRDYRSGLTENEQKVFDNVYNNRVAEAQEGGKELSKKEKDAIYDAVMKDLEKGRIDIDTIEEVLGEDVYKSYKDTIDYEDDILKQYEELGKKTNPTLAEMSLYDELKSQYNDIKQNSQREAIKSRLSEEVFGKVKDTKLAESYAEKARGQQKFEADLSQFDEKQQDHVKRALESGVLNNRNSAHDIVGLTAKIEADKGVRINYVNNKILKEMGIEFDGADTNGFVKDGVLYINVDSPKYLNFTVGHEITHTMKVDKKLYADMQRALFDVAKDKGEYDSRLKQVTETYKKYDPKADPKEELTADLVGDYLFTDEDFVKRLSTEHRNVFQKVWDEIKHLWKMATAGSREARELEKAMHLFEKVYRESGKTSGKASEGTKYSLDMVDAVKPTTNKWAQGATTDEVRAAHPTLYAVDETATEERNPTQVKGTVGSYRKVYESLKNEGFNGTILDASSGLGYGTKAGIEEYGFDVEDIEPYPDSDYKPKYTDYSALNKKYDVVISNAVLNVLPQDQRDALTIKMGELLNPGGRMFVNVRGKDVLNASGKIAINESNMEYFIPRTAKTGSYQKGFTKSELVAYLEDALGEGYTVKPTNMFGAVSAIVTKDGAVKYSIYDKKTIDKFSQKQYNDFGWARHTEAITENELDDMYSKIHEKGSLKKFPQTKYGESVIEVNDSPHIIEANNTFVFVKGSKNSPEITRVVRVNFYDEASIDVFRKDIYENTDNRSLEAYARVMGEEIVQYYDRSNSASYREYSEQSESRSSGSESKGNQKVARRWDIGDTTDTKTQSNDITPNKASSKDGVFFDGKNTKYSLSDSETDKTYADAVKNRDWETAQKLVDDAAKKAGYTRAVYHGTESRFTVFDTDEESITRPQHAWMADYPDGTIFLAEDYDVAGQYGNRVMEMYLDTNDIKVFEEPEMYAHRAMDDIYGYEVYNYPVIAVKGKDMTIYATLDNTLMKSSLAATYDDNGNLIPLSERFKHDNPDIRFSLSKSVEESGELMALHNLKGNELLKSLELGGLPMPSVAIIKGEAAHDQYGEISLILPKEAIDPKANKDNKVYGADAWTPTYPKIEYKPNEAVAKRISDKYYELHDKYGSEDARPLYNFTYDLENVLNSNGGEAALLEELYGSTRLMQAYLLDSGKGKVEPVKKEIRTELSDAEVEMNDFIIRELGADVVDGVMAREAESPSEHRIRYWKEHGEKIKESYRKLLTEEYGFSTEEIDNVVSGMKTYDYLKFVRDAYLYRKNGRITTKTETDYKATESAIKEAAGGGYKAWVDSLFKGIEEKSGIRNNADYFTSSGNRRKWESLHWENTLENVVRVMKQQNQTGADAIFGAHQIFATAAKEYGSIAEVKADADRLYKMSEEDYEAVKESYSKRMTDIANKIMDKGERNQFIALDNAMECIVDAVRNSKTQAGIYKELSQYRQLNVTKQDVDDIVSLVNDIANMPTGYFEAKPMRAVGFDEVGVFVIPRNADVKLKQELLNRGYAIAEYDPDVEGDRQKVVNSFEEYKFSLSDANAPQKRYGNYNIYGKDVRYEAPMQEVVSKTEITTPTVSKTETVEDVAPVTLPDEFAPIPEAEANAMQSENVDSLTDADVPPEMEAPYYGETQDAAPIDPFEDRDMKEVSRDRKTPAYMYENPEVKPFFQAEANILLGELERVEKPETFYNGWAKYEMSYEFAQDIPEIYRTERIASDTIVYLRDTIGMSYADIEKGLKAIIEDNGAENIAAAKKLEFVINDRLLYGYNDDGGFEIPANQDYINLLTEKEISEYSDEARKQFFEVADAYDPMADIAPVAATTEGTSEVPVNEQYEAIKPERKKSTESRLKRVKDSETSAAGKQRKWIGTSTDSEAVDGKVKPDDIPDDMRYYQPIPNKVTLGNANTRLDSMGYDASLAYFNSQFANKRVSLDDIALGERLIQEAVKRGDTKTASELIQNVSILGTELGQKVQALSIIKRLSPEGQLRMLQKTVERGKTRGDKSFEGVEITQEMIDHILKTYGKDGTYDQTKLNEAVEDVKKQIADQMKVTKLEKVNAWRYLSMLGNPKTHIRNLVSNVAMQGTVAVKNAVARTIESVAPIGNRTKTWKAATDAVKTFSQKTAIEMKDVLSDGGKYSEEASIKEKRDTFKNKVLNKVYNFNSDLLSQEDWWFSKPAFTNALSEYLTANGIETEQDIANNPEIIAKAKQYATEQSQIATFRQYSWLANKITEIEKRNVATNIAVGAVLPFKRTPINIAKTALNYSPLGFAKTLTYDATQVKNGKMEASELVDHLSQNITGSALTLVGYLLASAGFLNGGGEDDKEGKYDYQLGEQAYSITIGDATYSLSWLSPIAMPLFVGANAYEQLVEGKEWNGDVVMETLAQTLDPLSEMSFLSSLDSVLASYDSGIQKFAGIAQSAAQSYITQFAPTLLSQVAAVMDDTKRTTKVAGDSDFKFVDETINNLKYKIPFLRETLEPTTDIWGNDVKQTEDLLTRAFETFIAPYSKREDIATEIDSEIKSLYGMTGDDGLIPSIPYNYVNYKNEKYEMSAKEYTAYKEAYGQTAYELLGELFDTGTYQYASDEEKAEMVNKVYDYARDIAKQEFLAKKGVTYTNAKEDGEDIYREDGIKGAIEHDMMLDEYTFYREYPEKYAVAKSVGGYERYKTYQSELYDIKADKDEDGKSITGSRKEKVIEYVNNLDIDYGERLILFKSEYNADDTYNTDIIDYLNNREDISYDEMVTILRELGFTVKGDTITWD